jgi:hypothetical protein
MSEEIEDKNEALEATNEEVSDVESTVFTPVAPKVKKHNEAKKLVEEAKNMAYDSTNEIQDCKILLENDLRDYEDAKRALHSGGLDDAKALLVELGHISVAEFEIDETEAVFDSKDNIEPLMIKDVSSGRFTGFILALLAGIAAFMGLVFLATEKLGMVLDVTKMPDNSTINDISNWFSSLVGVENNPEVGIGIVALVVLLVMFLVYAIRVGLKSGSNLRFANHQMKETQKYITHKADCKIEMDRVDTHINDAIKTLHDYQVLLNEQNGKLSRILHFEGVKSEKHGYAHVSILEMKETKTLIENIQNFMVQPMSDEGKLSENTSHSLHEAKKKVESVISKLAQSVA